MSRLSAILGLLLASGLPLLAQERAKAPSDGVFDDTRALGPETREQLTKEMTKFRENFGADIWLVALTFLPQGQDLRAEALAFRRAWSGDRDAVLLLYNRSTDRETLTLSPGIWESLPTAELFLMRESLHKTVSDKTKPPEARLREGMLTMMQQLTSIKVRQATVSKVVTRDYIRLAKSFSIALISGAVLLALMATLMRQRGIHATRHCVLPQLQNAPRLGAGFSGGTSATWQEHSVDPD